MKVRTEFPRAVREELTVRIPVSGGRLLAGRMWLPRDADTDPVPAIVEAIPYRRLDGTILQDAVTHPWWAGHGYAAIRLDLAGSGDSDGVLLDEYLETEQDDLCEALAWIAGQSWCTGATGMIGISWGGFAALQVAARRPPSLKAIITCCSTDDRYLDDVHYMGGCLLNDNISWAAGSFPVSRAGPIPSSSARHGATPGSGASRRRAARSSVGHVINVGTHSGSTAPSSRTGALSRRRSTAWAAGPTATPTRCCA